MPEGKASRRREKRALIVIAQAIEHTDVRS